MTAPTLVVTINGRRTSVPEVPSSERLLDTLRGRLGLKGTKEGCRTGACGACTVLVDGQGTLSCLTLAHEVDGAAVTTIEGVDAHPVGRVVRSAFEKVGAVQCGYCTPGFVMALTGLLTERTDARPPLDELLEELSGNLCRCTGYASIVRAVTLAREERP